ncbi:MAG: hypothetical protein IPK16_15665 [Anaerolineales bacterium]|nr:hypothetical protein [Anaerolineales bacterium]
MLTFRDIRQASLPGPTALAIGNFDGLHLGHQTLLQELRATAVALAAGYGPRAQTALITFDPHPLSVLRPDEPNLGFTTAPERLSLAAMLGIDVGVIQPFTMEIAQMEPLTFVQLLKRHLGLAALVVGPDFALGRGRAGNITLLRALGAELDFTVHVIQPIATEGQSCAAASCANSCSAAMSPPPHRC